MRSARITHPHATSWPIHCSFLFLNSLNFSFLGPLFPLWPSSSPRPIQPTSPHDRLVLHLHTIKRTYMSRRRTSMAVYFPLSSSHLFQCSSLFDPNTKLVQNSMENPFRRFVFHLDVTIPQPKFVNQMSPSAYVFRSLFSGYF